MDLNNRDTGDKVISYESCGIRRELFKLHYESGEYRLHEKADAFEAFDFILESIHGWEAKNLPSSCTIERQGQDDCFIHHFFGLKRYEYFKCNVCRAESSNNNILNSNMFAETVFVPELLPTLATLGRGHSPEYTMQS